MGLYERLTSKDDTKISVHEFGSAVHLWLLGHVSDQRMASEFNLVGQDEIAQAQAIKAKYQSFGTAAEKAAFLLVTHSVFILCESNRMTKEEAATVLGLS